MAKQKTHIFIALVLVLLIIAAVTAWITHDKANDQNAADNTPAPVNSSEVIVTTAEPLETPSPIEPSDAPETPKPTESVQPVEPQGDGRVNQSGSFVSDTGTNLNLVVDWKAVSVDSHTLSVTVNVYVRSYSLDIGKRTGNSIYVNGNGYNFVSPAVTHTNDNSLSKTMITTVTVSVPAEAGSTVSIPVSVDWNYRGSYSGEELEQITAESIITINA